MSGNWKKLVHSLTMGAVALVVIGAAATPAQAWLRPPGGTVSSGGTGGSVPEIDPSAMASALTLLTGGALVLTDRIRRRKTAAN